jgi:homoserine kinase
MSAPGIKLRLPGTSANLGPGFDAVGLALSMSLTVKAEAVEKFSITATGRDIEPCGQLENNLILNTYRDVLAHSGAKVQPLQLTLHNEIPLGMGCGSSAAALCAGVALADHFGKLHLGDAGIVAEASRIEGHPDNVAACWFGGFTVSAQSEAAFEHATFPGNPNWRLMLALPGTSLATKKARALLPGNYSQADAVFNVQRVALLTAAFASSRLDLLRTAMQDRMHQPYRMDACPLLKALLPLASEPWIAGIALSGAGPSVLVFVDSSAKPAEEADLARVAEPGVEWLPLRIAGGAERLPL